MNSDAKGTLIRFAIPILRLIPFWGAIHAVMMFQFVIHADPLQKLFYGRIVFAVWGCLALVPFVVLRSKAIFRLYALLLSACLSFMAYDELIPFRFISPDFHGHPIDSGGGYSMSGNDDHVDYWISYPTFPAIHEVLLALVYFAPLALAFLYRRSFPLWTSPSNKRNPSSP